MSRGVFDFLTPRELEGEPLSRFSISDLHGHRRYLTEGEAEYIDFKLTMLNSKRFYPNTERVDYDMNNTPSVPSPHGFWFRIPRKYAPIVTNWPALRAAALRFLKEDTKKLTPEQMRAKEQADINRRREEAHRIIQERLDYVKRLKEYKLK